MAFDAFIKIGDIAGESTDDKHKGWIEISSYSLGESNATAGATSGTGGFSGGRVDFSSFNFTFDLSKASPKIALACANGQVIPEIKVELCRATGKKEKFLEYKFTNCFFQSYQTGGSSGGERPQDSAAFAFARVDLVYTEFDDKGGKEGDVKFHWDLTANKGG
jgi:type VI secretion system secreted protein Hcp